MKRPIFHIISFGALLLFFACQPKTSYEPFVLEEPEHFVKMQIPAENPLTVPGVALGKKLFFDPILSKNGKVSCATCHQPGHFFTDGNAFSVGDAGLLTRRSAPSLVNIGYHYTGIFWDGRGKSLEDQVFRSVTDSTELANTWENVLHTLHNHDIYPALFAKAFGASAARGIKPEMVMNAIAQYERTLVSGNSKYDQYLRGEAKLTPKEERGRLIFFDADPEHLPNSECGHCHLDPLFTSLQFFNNGLDDVDSLNQLKDKGLGGVTGHYFDMGKFKVPTLRNIAHTAPYMHDGRFADLKQVIEHYRSGGHYNENASPNVRPLKLGEEDIDGLIAFLNTLTDSTIIQATGLIN